MILTIDKMMTVVMNWLSQSLRWWQWWGCWWSPHNFVQAHERTRCQMMIIDHQIETNGHILIVGIRLGLYFSIYWEQWLIIIHWPSTIIRLERHFPWLWWPWSPFLTKYFYQIGKAFSLIMITININRCISLHYHYQNYRYQIGKAFSILGILQALLPVVTKPAFAILYQVLNSHHHNLDI